MKYHVCYDNIPVDRMGRGDLSGWCKATTGFKRPDGVIRLERSIGRPLTRRPEVREVAPKVVHDPAGVVLPVFSDPKGMSAGEMSEARLAGSDAYWVLLAKHGIAR